MYPQSSGYPNQSPLPAPSTTLGPPPHQGSHGLHGGPVMHPLPPIQPHHSQTDLPPHNQSFRPLYSAAPPPQPGHHGGPAGLTSPPLPNLSVKRAASQTPLAGETAQKKTSKWTQEEDELTVELRGSGMKWEDIAKRIPGRSAISCRLRYQNYLEKRAHWDEEKKNKLARLYVRFKEQMWQKVASEMGVPWRAAEAMHWQLGHDEIASRANQPVFQLSASAISNNNGAVPPGPQIHPSHDHSPVPPTHTPQPPMSSGFHAVNATSNLSPMHAMAASTPSSAPQRRRESSGGSRRRESGRGGLSPRRHSVQYGNHDANMDKHGPAPHLRPSTPGGYVSPFSAHVNEGARRPSSDGSRSIGRSDDNRSQASSTDMRHRAETGVDA